MLFSLQGSNTVDHGGSVFAAPSHRSTLTIVGCFPLPSGDCACARIALFPRLQWAFSKKRVTYNGILVQEGGFAGLTLTVAIRYTQYGLY